jgi:hypothetical protein
MPPSENPSTSPAEAAAQKLESLKKKDVQLGIVPGDMGVVNMKFDSQKGDKGLTYLAKRYYKEVARYSDQDALNASLALTARFIRKLGEPNPSLMNGDELSINQNTATLTRTHGNNLSAVGIELGDLSTPPRVEAPIPATSPGAQRQQLMMEIIGAPAPEKPKTPEQAVAAHPLRDRLSEAQEAGRIQGYGAIENSLPQFGIEAYDIMLNNGQRYYLAAQLTKRDRNGEPYVTENPKYRLASGGMTGQNVVNWTSNFDEITSHLA